MTIIEREVDLKTVARRIMYELMSTNDFWGDPKIPLITVHQRRAQSAIRGT